MGLSDINSNARLYDKDGNQIDATHPVHVGLASGLSADIGATLDVAVTDPTASASVIAALKGIISQLQGTGPGSAPVDLVTALSSTYDSINVNKMSKGAVVVAHDAIVITTTSTEIDCRGFNTISVECAVSAITSGNWQIECLGCAVTGGTFGRCYNMNGLEMKVTGLDTNETRALTFYGVPNYTKIRATRTTDGTLTCKVTPFNS